MNGNTVPILVWVLNLIVGVLITLVGFVVRLHMKSDEDHRAKIDEEIIRLRDRLHDLGNMVGDVKAAVYYIEKDKK